MENRVAPDAETEDAQAYEEMPPDSDTLCAICADATITRCALGYQWCAAHAERGDFLTRGASHGFPLLSQHPYALAEGVSAWVVTATLADDDRFYTLYYLLLAEEQEGKVA